MSEEDVVNKRLRAVVEGRVQGVGFRYFVARKAEELGIKGWVRNRFDGSVELEAEGSAEDLRKLANFIRKGPRGSFVSDVKLAWEEPVEQFVSFRIRRTG